jgi:hypothetical protein
MNRRPSAVRRPAPTHRACPRPLIGPPSRPNLDRLRVREKAHTREGDAIAAARRRLPMVEVAANLELIGPNGPLTLLEAFEGRRQLIAYYFMWHPGHPAAEQCEGCTWCTTQVAELSYLHSRDITYAVFCQGPYDESSRYRDTATPSWTSPCTDARSRGRTRPPAGHNSGKSTAPTRGRTDAPSPSGRDSKPDTLTTSPLGPDRRSRPPTPTWTRRWSAIGSSPATLSLMEAMNGQG